VTSPLCGFIYTLEIPGAGASHILVLTEDLWNQQMGDSVVVPIYDLPEAEASLFRVAAGERLKADCTRVQTMSQEFIGKRVVECPHESWVRVRIGVWKFLDIDRRIAKMLPPDPANPASAWWPRQNDIHFAGNLAISTQDKLYAVVSDNDWNALPGVANVAAVRLTSKTKPQRLRWEVPVGDSGFVVAGDIYSIATRAFEQKTPPKRYPSRLTEDESAAIAVKQRSALTLS
jgi:mRNA-degrading endonuclease toxin of MazEF toxin-antitoxin module